MHGLHVVCRVIKSLMYECGVEYDLCMVCMTCGLECDLRSTLSAWVVLCKVSAHLLGVVNKPDMCVEVTSTAY